MSAYGEQIEITLERRDTLHLASPPQPTESKPPRWGQQAIPWTGALPSRGQTPTAQHSGKASRQQGDRQVIILDPGCTSGRHCISVPLVGTNLFPRNLSIHPPVRMSRDPLGCGPCFCSRHDRQV
jgi:hypothetical protein